VQTVIVPPRTLTAAHRQTVAAGTALAKPKPAEHARQKWPHALTACRGSPPTGGTPSALRCTPGAIAALVPISRVATTPGPVAARALTEASRAAVVHSLCASTLPWCGSAELIPLLGITTQRRVTTPTALRTTPILPRVAPTVPPKAAAADRKVAVGAAPMVVVAVAPTVVVAVADRMDITDLVFPFAG